MTTPHNDSVDSPRPVSNGVSGMPDIRALADLANIEIQEGELLQLKREIPTILAFVETIRRAPVTSLRRQPDVRNVMRDDERAHESGKFSKTLLAAAPFTKNGKLIVKQVIKKSK